MIRVALLIRSPVQRAGLRSLLEDESDIAVIEAADPAVIGMAYGDQTDVLVLDGGALSEPGVAASVDAYNPAGVLALVAGSPADLRLAAGIGAPSWGVLPESADPAEIAAAVRSLAVGLVVISPSFLGSDSWIRGIWEAEDMEPLPEELTVREMEVLALLARGLPNKQIAQELFISENTVKFHVSSICGKLGAANRTEAVRLGLRRGLISL